MFNEAVQAASDGPVVEDNSSQHPILTEEYKDDSDDY